MIRTYKHQLLIQAVAGFTLVPSIDPKILFEELTVRHDSLLNFLGTEEDMAKIIDIPIGTTLNLLCNIKPDNGGSLPKVWYYRKRYMNSTLGRVVKVNRNSTVHCTNDNRLVLKNFTLEDAGIYKCIAKAFPENITITYVLDGAFLNHYVLHIENKHQQQLYKRMKIDPINHKLEKSQMDMFQSLRNGPYSYRVFTNWEPWTDCIVKDGLSGIRKRFGKCRLHPVPTVIHHAKLNCTSTTKQPKYLIDEYDISCHSMTLALRIPKLSRMVRRIPDLVMTIACRRSETATDKMYLSHKMIENNLTKTQNVPENGHITLTCPDITLESKVKWYKNNKLLGPSFRNNMASEEEPHITIDAYNALYILHATKHEEGLYVCFVDGEKVQIFIIKIVSNSKMLNQDFIRYSIYLSIILSLTLICYCAGICVAWHRRSSFLDPIKRN